MKDQFSSLSIRQYWNFSMEHLPSYHHAPSTLCYREEEVEVIKKFLSPLKGKSFLKTDLWNEVKNTRILPWAATQGALTFAFDISDQVTSHAQKSWPSQITVPALCVADIRYLPYQDNSFDRLYSMGTAEHTPDYRQAFQELFRVLKPGGQAVIGVPNKYDPFLRPLLVWGLQKFKLYSFGYEKSFSRRELSHQLKEIGFKVVGHSSLLFMPGFLRILDLFLYTKKPHWTIITKGAINFFHFLYQKSKLAQKHGYLLAVAVEKPRPLRSENI